MPIQTNGTQDTQTESHIKTCCISLFVACLIVSIADIVVAIVAFLSPTSNTVAQLVLSLIPALLGILVGFLLLISVGKKHVEELHRIDSINTLASNTLLLEWGYATRKRNKMMSPEEVSRIENDELLTHPHFLCTKHNAYNTFEAAERQKDICIDNIESFLNATPLHIVN